MSSAIMLALLAAAHAPPADHCAKAAAAAPTKTCLATAHGAVLATTAAEAARLAAILRDGEARFMRHFGQSPTPYAVIQDAASAEAAALRAAGFRRTLPWLTPAQREAAVLASIRRGVEGRIAQGELDLAQAAAAVEQAEQAWRAANPPARRTQQEATILPHEAGHGWYIESYWPTTPGAQRSGHYGGPGPDWLDETAAILMEDDRSAADRRAVFERIYRGNPPSGALSGLGAAELIDLRHFLTREHPAYRMLENRARNRPSGTDTVVVLVADEARQVARGGALFYLQGRMFADFLIERTGDPAVFAQIGAAFGRGESMEQWLAAAGSRHRLPGTLAELDAAWRAWLTGKFGAPVLSGTATGAAS